MRLLSNYSKYNEDVSNIKLLQPLFMEKSCFAKEKKNVANPYTIYDRVYLGHDLNKKKMLIIIYLIMWFFKKFLKSNNNFLTSQKKITNLFYFILFSFLFKYIKKLFLILKF